MQKISVYIIAYNSAEKIARAVKSVLWADEIIVADSHSQDDTAKIAQSLGARVVQIDFQGFGDLRNKAVAACQHEWIFSLDSDEICTPEARDEMLSIINSPDALDAYYMPRKNYFMGRWIKHSGWYPDYRQPQLFRKGAVIYGNDQVHERFELATNKPAGKLTQAIYQIPYENLGEMMHKANRYSTLGVMSLKKRYAKLTMSMAVTHSLWTFVRQYLLKKGFLDGWPGFVIAMGASYGVFFRYAKAYEVQENWPKQGSSGRY